MRVVHQHVQMALVILQNTHPGHSDDLGNEVGVQSSVSQKCNGFEFDVLGPLRVDVLGASTHAGGLDHSVEGLLSKSRSSNTICPISCLSF